MLSIVFGGRPQSEQLPQKRASLARYITRNSMASVLYAEHRFLWEATEWTTTATETGMLSPLHHSQLHDICFIC